MTQALKSGGLRMTPQRLEIIREIAKAKDHPDADVILARVRERVPMLSRDTVYRTMDALVDAGLINKILMPRATRFDPDRLPHHHFICERCGKIVDIDADTVSPLPSVPRMLDGIGDVRAVHVHIQGVCHRCSEGHTQDQKRARS
jgi:Fur family peroxide stress response transcriptional regulator